MAARALGADVIQAGTALIGAEDFMAGLSGHRPVDAARQGCLAGLRRSWPTFDRSRESGRGDRAMGETPAAGMAFSAIFAT